MATLGHDRIGYRSAATLAARIRRREFIALLAAELIAWPLAAKARNPLPVIAILDSGAANAGSSIEQMRLFDAGMRELGLLQGRDYMIESRWAYSDSSRFPALARELLARDPVAVVVSAILAAKAVQNLSRTAPIVMTGLNDPAGFGLIESASPQWWKIPCLRR